jgi:hypothetical protein
VPKPVSRPLTSAERALARALFGDAIDYDAVKLHHRKWFPFQPVKTLMAPTGGIWFHPKGPYWHEDFGEASLNLQALFLHEMTHVWQYQSGIFLPLRRHPFCRYDYVLRPGWPFKRYGLEQQAEIIRHTFLLRHGKPVSGAPPLATYEALLPFRQTTGQNHLKD